MEICFKKKYNITISTVKYSRKGAHEEEGGKPSSEFHWSYCAMTNQNNYGTYLWP